MYNYELLLSKQPFINFVSDPTQNGHMVATLESGFPLYLYKFLKKVVF